MNKAPASLENDNPRTASLAAPDEMEVSFTAAEQDGAEARGPGVLNPARR